jgi:hypothetical protein
MKSFVLAVTAIGIITILGLVFYQVNLEQEGNIGQVVGDDFRKKLSIQTPAFPPNGTIGHHYTCDGGDVNPRILLRNIPSNAKSLAIVVDDPDVIGEPWVHWVVWNINPSREEIPEDSVPPSATEGTTSFGEPGYRGPCPPPGEEHHYTFKVYALNTQLSLPETARKEELLRAMLGHIIEENSVTGVYRRRE